MPAGTCVLLDIEEPQSREDDLHDITMFSPMLCWKVTKEGIERHAEGDSCHGKSQTRFVRSLLNITRQTFLCESIETPWKILLLSNRAEGPLITSAFEPLSVFQIFHQVEERIVNVKELSLAILGSRMEVNDLIIALAMSGCDECRSTIQVGQACYVKALFRCHSQGLQLFKDSYAQLSTTTADVNAWDNMQVFVATAYVFGRLKTAAVPSHIFQGQAEGLRSWTDKIRRTVGYELLRNPIPGALMPEAEDLILQFHRVMATLRYWTAADGDHCGALNFPSCFETGFLSEGLPIHDHGESLTRKQKTNQYPNSILQVQYPVCSTCSGENYPLPVPSARDFVLFLPMQSDYL